MEKTKPMKRHPGLQPLSRDHHNGLLLCWKLRMGFAKEIPPQRIAKYSRWFYEVHLRPHFLLEEEHVFPVLGGGHDLVKKAIAQHRQLERLFSKEEIGEEDLKSIEQILQEHIRLEERELFGEVQKIASSEELEKIAEIHHEEDFTENTEDEFWK